MATKGSHDSDQNKPYDTKNVYNLEYTKDFLARMINQTFTGDVDLEV